MLKKDSYRTCAQEKGELSLTSSQNYIQLPLLALASIYTKKKFLLFSAIIIKFSYISYYYVLSTLRLHKIL